MGGPTSKLVFDHALSLAIAEADHDEAVAELVGLAHGDWSLIRSARVRCMGLLSFNPDDPEAAEASRLLDGALRRSQQRGQPVPRDGQPVPRDEGATRSRAPASSDGLPPGTRVEVYNGFSPSWARGFRVADARDGVYRVQRLSDGAVLPKDFGAAELRKA